MTVKKLMLQPSAPSTEKMQLHQTVYFLEWEKLSRQFWSSVLPSQDPSAASYPAGRVGEWHADHSAGDRNQLSSWYRAHCLSLPGLARRGDGHGSGWEVGGGTNMRDEVMYTGYKPKSECFSCCALTLNLFEHKKSLGLRVCTGLWRFKVPRPLTMLLYFANTRWGHRITLISCSDDGNNPEFVFFLTLIM